MMLPPRQAVEWRPIRIDLRQACGTPADLPGREAAGLAVVSRGTLPSGLEIWSVIHVNSRAEMTRQFSEAHAIEMVERIATLWPWASMPSQPTGVPLRQVGWIAHEVRSGFTRGRA